MKALCYLARMSQDSQRSASLRRASLSWAAVLLVSASFSVTQVQAAESALSGMLTWKNTTSLPGSLMGGQADLLSWRTTFSSEPAQIQLHHLRRANFDGPNHSTSEPWAIFLRDGSRLHGKITAINESTLTLQSSAHGEITLARGNVQEILRMSGKPVIYAGPSGMADWKLIASENFNQGRQAKPELPVLTATHGGALRIGSLNRRIQLEKEIPERTEVFITLSSKIRPEFSITLSNARPDEVEVVVETWQDEVVLRYGDQYAPLQTLREDDRALGLRVIWDQKERKCLVTSVSGKQLCDWLVLPEKKAPVEEAQPKAGEEKKPPAARAAVRVRMFPGGEAPLPVLKGIVLLSKAPDLTLDRIQFQEWNGNLPAERQHEGSSVSVIDGAAYNGEVLRADAERLTLQKTDGSEIELPMEQVTGANFPFTGPLPPRGADTTELRFSDGAQLAGTLDMSGSGELALKVPFSQAPITFKTQPAKTGENASPAALRSMHFYAKGPANQPARVPLNQLDTLTLMPRDKSDVSNVYGTWVASSDASIQWMLHGAVKSVPVNVHTASPKITRATPPDDKLPPSATLIHLKSGESFPATITSLDAEEVHFESTVVAIKQLPRAAVRAFQFPGQQMSTTGFSDNGWQIVRGDGKKVERSGDTVTLTSGGAFGHPGILVGDEVTFSLSGVEGYTALRLRMGCSGTDTASDHISLLIASYGSGQFYAGSETTPGQFNNQLRTVSSSKEPLLRVLILGDGVELYMDGALWGKIPMQEAQLKRAGSGLIFEPGDLWGNGERPLKLARVTVPRPAGVAWLPAVDDKNLSQLLTVPRFRKDAPARQALIAMTGDLLRGELVSATKQHFLFRVGLEEHQVPRDRVAAVVWLDKPEAGPGQKNETDSKPVTVTPEASTPAPSTELTGAAEGASWLTFFNGAHFAIKLDKFDQGVLLGHSAVLGSCRVPISEIFTLYPQAPKKESVQPLFTKWKLKSAAEPVLPTSQSQNSPLIGKMAHEIKLPLMGGGDFQLNEQKGKVVVLDFWATWCAPCIKSMPELIATVGGFPQDKVQFIGVNQGEPEEQIKKFLQQRGWQFPVAMDAAQLTGRHYGVEGIPHTVVVAPDGKIAWVHTGYTPTAATEMAEIIKSLLAPEAGGADGK